MKVCSPSIGSALRLSLLRYVTTLSCASAVLVCSCLCVSSWLYVPQYVREVISFGKPVVYRFNFISTVHCVPCPVVLDKCSLRCMALHCECRIFE